MKRTMNSNLKCISTNESNNDHVNKNGDVDISSITRRYSKNELFALKPVTLTAAHTESKEHDNGNSKEKSKYDNKINQKEKEKENDGKKPKVTTLNVHGGLKLKLLRNRD